MIVLYNSDEVFRVCIGSMVVVSGFVFIPPNTHNTHAHYKKYKL